MLTDDEAVAVVLGLLAAGGSGSTRAAPVDGALAKIHRVLPDALRRRVEALEATLAFTELRPAPRSRSRGDAALALAEAIRRRRRVRTGYRTFSGEQSERELSPHGLVVHSGRWYLAAFDHGRDDLRTFRVDRMSRGRSHGGTRGSRRLMASTRSPQVSRSLARVPWTGRSRCCSTSRSTRPPQRIPATLAELIEAEERNAASDAGGLARLDGGRARRARLPVRGPAAGRAAGERARAGGAAHGVGGVTADDRWAQHGRGSLPAEDAGGWGGMEPDSHERPRAPIEVQER